MMAGVDRFIDYYNTLRVSPTCDRKALESAYRDLAKMYHPDHSGAADTTKFKEVVEAFRVLRDAESRAEYDKLYAANVTEDPEDRRRFCSDGWVDHNSALNDADDHTRILMHLYQARRENAQNAGVVAFYLQEMLECSDEHFEFHKWYLKEKGFITITEHGTLAITAIGIDHVISMSRRGKAGNLLIAQVNRQD